MQQTIRCGSMVWYGYRDREGAGCHFWSCHTESLCHSQNCRKKKKVCTFPLENLPCQMAKKLTRRNQQMDIKPRTFDDSLASTDEVCLAQTTPIERNTTEEV